MCDFKKARIANKWQRRVNELVKADYGDCDQIGVKVLKEMQAQGLVLGKDMVVVRGTCEGKNHFAIGMYGKNSPDKDGRPVFKINGYRIGTARGYTMKNVWKGEYGKS